MDSFVLFTSVSKPSVNFEFVTAVNVLLLSVERLS